MRAPIDRLSTPCTVNWIIFTPEFTTRLLKCRAKNEPNSTKTKAPRRKCKWRNASYACENKILRSNRWTDSSCQNCLFANVFLLIVIFVQYRLFDVIVYMRKGNARVLPVTELILEQQQWCAGSIMSGSESPLLPVFNLYCDLRGSWTDRLRLQYQKQPNISASGECFVYWWFTCQLWTFYYWTKGVKLGPWQSTRNPRRFDEPLVSLACIDEKSNQCTSTVEV